MENQVGAISDDLDFETEASHDIIKTELEKVSSTEYSNHQHSQSDLLQIFEKDLEGTVEKSSKLTTPAKRLAGTTGQYRWGCSR